MALNRVKDRKTGKGPKDIFTATGKGREAPGSKRGRPPKHEEPPEKISVSLRPDQVVQLDGWSLKIREGMGKSLKRSEIIRAMVDAVRDSGIAVTAAGSEEELKELLEAGLRHE